MTWLLSGLKLRMPFTSICNSGAKEAGHAPAAAPAVTFAQSGCLGRVQTNAYLLDCTHYCDPACMAQATAPHRCELAYQGTLLPEHS
jgi:hypothetical protein